MTSTNQGWLDYLFGWWYQARIARSPTFDKVIQQFAEQKAPALAKRSERCGLSDADVLQRARQLIDWMDDENYAECAEYRLFDRLVDLFLHNRSILQHDDNLREWLCESMSEMIQQGDNHLLSAYHQLFNDDPRQQ